jgi:thioredoxin-dependent peroxiredoxin
LVDDIYTQEISTSIVCYGTSRLGIFFFSRFRWKKKIQTTQELYELSRLSKDFEKRNVNILVVVPDKDSNRERLIKDMPVLFEDPPSIPFEMHADETGILCKSANILSTKAKEYKGNRLRRNVMKFIMPSVILVDKFRRVRYVETRSPDIGRNLNEIVRTIDALQVVSSHRVECPSNWAAGEDVFIADEVTDKEATTEFERGMAYIKPWLRITPMPTPASSFTKISTSLVKSSSSSNITTDDDDNIDDGNNEEQKVLVDGNA